MNHLYPFVEALVIAACLAPIAFLTAVISRTGSIRRALGWTAAGVGWFLLVWELARAGAFEGTRSRAPFASLLVAAVPVAIGWLVLRSRRSAALGPIARPAELIAVQAYRLVAVVVLLALAGDAVPAWLALPIGLGDSVVGLAALSVAHGLRTGGGGAARAAAEWNAAGALLALFTIVATSAAAHSAGYFFSLYPLVLFPTFLAPCSLLLHLAARRAASMDTAGV